MTYLKLGVEHIIGGIDHLLFVLALLILVKGTRRLIATVTAFTVALSEVGLPQSAIPVALLFFNVGVEIG